MEYLWAFLVGGLLCAIGQILIDFTKLTPARILVMYVVIGVILGSFGIYDKLIDFAGAGATDIVKKLSTNYELDSKGRKPAPPWVHIRNLD